VTLSRDRMVVLMIHKGERGRIIKRKRNLGIVQSVGTLVIILGTVILSMTFVLNVRNRMCV